MASSLSSSPLSFPLQPFFTRSCFLYRSDDIFTLIFSLNIGEPGIKDMIITIDIIKELWRGTRAIITLILRRCFFFSFRHITLSLFLYYFYFILLLCHHYYYYAILLIDAIHTPHISLHVITTYTEKRDRESSP